MLFSVSASKVIRVGVHFISNSSAMSFMVRWYTKGNHLVRDELNDLGLRIRDRIHLLTANSSWIEEIKDNRFPERSSLLNCFVPIRQPLNLVSHVQTSLTASAVLLSPIMAHLMG
jgi:hypothetical protein